VSSILPEMQTACLQCTSCGNQERVMVNDGGINEPNFCSNQECSQKNTYQIMYHRCEFTDRQLIKVQESPESIPQGETPKTINIYCHGSMVDFCKPGDRIKVTGVYRCLFIFYAICTK